MTRFYHDFETYSAVDLKKVGGSKYARHPSTEVLMMAYAFDDGPVALWVPVEGEPMPLEVEDALQDPNVEMHAWNAAFERAIWTHVLGRRTPLRRWFDTMISAHYCSLSGKLEQAGKALGMDADLLKNPRGTTLINRFCKPRKPTKKLPHTRATHETDPDDWAEFKHYCIQDVVAERATAHELRAYPMPDHEWDNWRLDQVINNAGMPINRQAVEGAIAISQHVFKDRIAKMREITGLANPNSQPQLLQWLQSQGYPFNDLKAGHVEKALKEAEEHDISFEAEDVLKYRQEIGKTSTKKFPAVLEALDSDDRLRGCFQFYGAQRTGRYAGRRLQPQNLPRPLKFLEDEKAMRDAIRDIELFPPNAFEAAYDDPMGVLASCIRPIIQAPKGTLFADCDLSAIENVVIGWLAGDRRILSVFEKGLDPYIDFATNMFHLPYDEIAATVKGGDKSMRTLAKPPVLGCGYMLGGGEEKEDPDTGEIIGTGLLGYAWGMGVMMTEDQTQSAVRVWRQTFTRVVDHWKELDTAFRRCVQTGRPQVCREVEFDRRGSFVRCWLPSGRALHYYDPKLLMRRTPWGEQRLTITYMGLNDRKQWVRISTHPGKILENITQAVARDLLQHGMRLAYDAGLDIRMHVHDQIVALVPEDTADEGLEVLKGCMTDLPSWARGMPVGAAGTVNRLFLKD